MTHTTNVRGRVGFTPLGILGSFFVLLLITSSAFAQNPCEVVDNGSGTVDLPPIGCEYLTSDEVHLIIDGLPPGTTIELAPIHTVLEAGADHGVGERVPVTLAANVTEMGTLELWCVARDSSGKWKLSYSVRDEK